MTLPDKLARWRELRIKVMAAGFYAHIEDIVELDALGHELIEELAEMRQNLLSALEVFDGDDTPGLFHSVVNRAVNGEIPK